MNLKRLRGYTRLGEVRKVHLGDKKTCHIEKKAIWGTLTGCTAAWH